MSANAAGITATLFAINTLAFRYPHPAKLSARYYQLRDFACTHAEVRPIIAAID